MKTFMSLTILQEIAGWSGNMKAVKALEKLFPYERDSENYALVLRACEEYDRNHRKPTQQELEDFFEGR